MSRYQKFKEIARQHVDQTIRTSNFKARNERIEKGASVKSQRKGENVSVEERKLGEYYQWKATWQCSKEDSCRSNHGSRSGQGAQSSSSSSEVSTQTDGRKHHVEGVLRDWKTENSEFVDIWLRTTMDANWWGWTDVLHSSSALQKSRMYLEVVVARLHWRS